MVGPHPLSVPELEEQLRRQVRYLRRSAAAYDNEDATEEAFRLATTVRVLCHHTANSKSLLHQLGLLPDRLRFVDTAPRLPDLPPGGFAISPGLGLCIMRFDFDTGTATPTPLLDDLDPHRINPVQQFDRWWSTQFLTNDSPVRGARTAFTYSRRDIVLAMANKDGGAHVDPEIPAQYRAAANHDGIIGFAIDGMPVSIEQRAFVVAWMRQIAHEVQRSLERDFRTQAILEGRPSGLTLGP